MFNENERKKANKIVKRYLKRGYDDNDEDDNIGKYKFCHQLISKTEFKKS